MLASLQVNPAQSAVASCACMCAEEQCEGGFRRRGRKFPRMLRSTPFLAVVPGGGLRLCLPGAGSPGLLRGTVCDCACSEHVL